MTGLEIPAVKKLVGLAGVAVSLDQKGGITDNTFNLDEAYKSVLGQAVGGFFYNLIKSGGNASTDLLKQFRQTNLRSDNLNHDLQKAARKAQLIAAFFASQHFLEKLKEDYG